MHVTIIIVLFVVICGQDDLLMSETNWSAEHSSERKAAVVASRARATSEDGLQQYWNRKRGKHNHVDRGQSIGVCLLHLY